MFHAISTVNSNIPPHGINVLLSVKKTLSVYCGVGSESLYNRRKSCLEGLEKCCADSLVKGNKGKSKVGFLRIQCRQTTVVVLVTLVISLLVWSVSLSVGQNFLRGGKKKR